VTVSVRSAPPYSLPGLVWRPWLHSNVEKITFPALVSRLDDQAVLEPDQPWPPLVIDFDRPQRAVGLEFVAPSIDGHSEGRYAAAAYRLEAFDAAGNAIPSCESDATHLTSDERNNAGLVGRLLTDRVRYIGVRDDFGQIASVRFRTLRERERNPNNPGPQIRNPPAVIRIWHEPLPPAAVLQSEIELVGPAGIPGSLDGVSLPIRLPFALDRAVVFLRGFRFEFLDQRPRPVNGLGVRVGNVNNGRAELEVDAFREVKVRVSGTLDPPGPDQPAFSVRAYFGLLAWDSRQVLMHPHDGDVILGRNPDQSGDPFSPSGQTYKLGVNSEDYVGWAVYGVPHAVMAAGASNGFYDVGMTAYFHAGIRFGVSNTATTGLARLSASTQTASRELAGAAMRVYHALGATARVYTHSAPELTLLPGIRPLMLDGPGQAGRIDANPYAIAPRPLGPRQESPNGGFQFWSDLVLGEGPAHINPFVIEIDRDVDLAVVSLDSFRFEPQDQIRELDVEVRGKKHEDRFVEYQLGAGTATKPLGQPEAHFIPFVPLVSGVVTRKNPRSHARSHHSKTVNVNTSTTTAVTEGRLWNLGSAPLMVSDCVIDGPDIADFTNVKLRLHATDQSRNRTVDADKLWTSLPFRVFTGEYLAVSATFQPSATGPRLAFLRFLTNGIAPIAEQAIELRGVGVLPGGVASLSPARIDFFGCRVDEDRHAFVDILCAGAPVYIDAFHFTGPGAAYFSAVPDGAPRPSGPPYEIKAGHTLRVRVTVRGRRAWTTETATLTFDASVPTSDVDVSAEILPAGAHRGKIEDLEDWRGRVRRFD
jgi:hypothetical protein